MFLRKTVAPVKPRCCVMRISFVQGEVYIDHHILNNALRIPVGSACCMLYTL
jgi:hypothetical protein